MFVFLVVLVFLLNLVTAGLDPQRPLFPIPLPRPRAFALEIEPRVRVPLFPPVPTNLIFCSVFFLQKGQNLFVFFGIFILSWRFVGLKRFLYYGPALIFMRVKFDKGKQREFLNKVMEEVSCPSLRELSRRLDLNYSSLKNYFNEDRTLSKELLDNLCLISKLEFRGRFVGENWGQIKGGKRGRRKARFKYLLLF